MRTLTRADIAQITGYSAKYVRDNLTKRPGSDSNEGQNQRVTGVAGDFWGIRPDFLRQW